MKITKKECLDCHRIFNAEKFNAFQIKRCPQCQKLYRLRRYNSILYKRYMGAINVNNRRKNG